MACNQNALGACPGHDDDGLVVALGACPGHDDDGPVVALGACPGHDEIDLSKTKWVNGISYPVHNNKSQTVGLSPRLVWDLLTC